MPIYAYKCSACGHAKDVLQKISDDPLTQCPACHADAFTKQLTAAGFQLKGSGWYVTDFKGGSNNTTTPAAAEGSAATAGAATSAEASGASSSAASESTSSAATSATTTSAASCGASCACH